MRKSSRCDVRRNTCRSAAYCLRRRSRAISGRIRIVTCTGVRSLSVGTNVAVPESNADVSLVLDLDDLDALQAYQEHPAHLEVVAYIRSVTGSRMAVDFEV